MKILTSDGFQDFDGIVSQGTPSRLLHIIFESGNSIKCTDDHRFLFEGEYVESLFLECGMSLGQEIISSIEELPGEEVYDALNVANGNHYTTNGVESHNCNLIMMDEFAFVQNATEFYTSTYPVISSGLSTQVIITSTANGVGNQFYKIWEGAVQGSNEFKPIRVDWWDVPGRDENWKKQTIANTSPLQFEQEFGNSFVGTSNTLLASDCLLGLRAAVPFYTKNSLRLYEAPDKTHLYVMTVDVSKGRGQDYSTFTVFDITQRPFKQVAVFRDNRMSPLMFPEMIVKIAKQYNNAMVVIENNDAGVVVCNAVYYEYEYENTFVESAVKSGGVGVTMTKRVKRVGCSNLKDLIEMGKLTLTDAQTIAELSTFEISGSSFEASEGNHDDLVMNLVMFAWFVSTEAFGENIENFNLKDLLFADAERMAMEELVPFGFLVSGTDSGSPAGPMYDKMADDLRRWKDL